jgi:hypothetical protein
MGKPKDLPDVDLSKGDFKLADLLKKVTAKKTDPNDPDPSAPVVWPVFHDHRDGHLEKIMMEDIWRSHGWTDGNQAEEQKTRNRLSELTVNDIHHINMKIADVLKWRDGERGKTWKHASEVVPLICSCSWGCK